MVNELFCNFGKILCRVKRMKGKQRMYILEIMCSFLGVEMGGYWSYAQGEENIDNHKLNKQKP